MERSRTPADDRNYGVRKMNSAPPVLTLLLAVVVSLALPSIGRAEMVEEIIAWVNGDIITRTEYEMQLQAQTADAYQRLAGEELDQELERIKNELLIGMIDNKILLHHGQALGYDLERMADSFLELFMEQQGFTSVEEVEQLATQDGMTLDDIKRRLVEMHAPDEVIRFEVANRVSVGEREIEAYYRENPHTFEVEGEVELREIVLLAQDASSKDARREEARELWNQLRDGTDFASLAREKSEAGTAANGGKLGPLERVDLSEILANVAFTLPVGELSELMETPYGFHIIKVVSRVDEHTRNLDDVRERIRAFLQDQKTRTELADFLEKAREESEWCVKPKHKALLSVSAPPPCERL
jgi:parvulin-like peptidyl-prolyl isomerase